MANIVAHCPECGGTDIREKNVAYADLRVTVWEFNGDDGLSPIEYDADEEAEWEQDGHDVAPYVCHGIKDEHRCTWEGHLFELAVEHEPDDDEG